MTHKIQNSIFLAAAAMFASIPMFQYQFLYCTDVFNQPPSNKEAYYLAVCQAFMIFSVALLSALVGFLYAQRLHLPGFGKLNEFKFWLPLGLILGSVLTPVSYYLFDKDIMRSCPQLFPDALPYALAFMVGTVIDQEVIIRFGLLTIGMYFQMRWQPKVYPWPVFLVITGFVTMGSYFGLSKFGLADQLSLSQVIIPVGGTFIFQWIYCEIYIRKGLLAVFYFHFGMTVKYAWYALLF